ncbi:MAG: hypothetical protein RL662_913 [Bacteroidota bacterium]|jgi:hypothetical protein
MKKILGPFVLLFLVFFHIYQQALPVFGSSFIIASGSIGLLVYLLNGRPFPEIIGVGLAYVPFVVTSVISGYANAGIDAYLWANTKSQAGWLFSAYLIVYLFFIIHQRGHYITLLYYMVAAVAVQCIISILMYQNSAINTFFTSIQMQDTLIISKREDTEGERLLGFGIAFFGAGIICGSALILITYIMIRKKMGLLLLAFWSSVYSLILFIGLLSARTTMVGLLASIVFAVSVFIFGKSQNKWQFLKFAAISGGLSTIASTLCYIYFPEFADWAFEAFINYSETGEFSTKSSDSLEYMFLFPRTFNEWLFGIGTMNFMGFDVGYSRLLFYAGIPGMLAFFFYEFALAKFACTKDMTQNLMMLTFCGYSLALNVKGLAEVNSFLYIFVFYFWYYKHYIYRPQLYRLGKINSNKLRYAVQSPTSRRRI